jgi:uncharacterized repeat protein (TIGR03803 family)
MPLSRVLLTALAIAGCGVSHASAAKLTNLLSFTNYDGAAPEDGPIEVNGQFFGTTVLGGTAGAGVIFQADPTTGAETVLYNFQGGKDAWEPQAGLVYHDGQLFGTTDWGGNPPKCGNNGCGTVFRFDIKTGKEVILHRFSGGADGATPAPGNLVYLKGKLYGTTWQGGAAGFGTVYAIDAQTGAETVLHSFSGGTDGTYPQSGLTYVKGILYGLTDSGGSNVSCGSYGTGCGTAFAIDPSTGTETILHAFTGAPDAAIPWGNLAYHDGTLYGAAYGGGSNSIGAIFSVNAATGAESVLYSFSGPDGALADGVIYHEGHLYGSTVGGGPCRGNCYNYGDVFDFDLKTGKEKVLYTFTDDSNGGMPYGRLLYMNGFLFGTTMTDGTGCECGTLFKIKR